MAEQISFEQVFRHTSNGVIVSDAAGSIVHINSQAAKILGLSGERKGAVVWEIIPQVGKKIYSCIESGSSILGFPISDAGYSVILNITPIIEADRILGTVCNFQDLKQFERSAQQLASYKMLNKQLKAIFQSVSDAIWVCDGKGVVIDINKASEKLNDIKASEVVGQNIATLVAEGMYDKSVTSMVLKTRRQETIVQRIIKTGRDVLVTGTPVFNENGDISLVVINSRDLTMLNQIQQELENSRLEAESLKDALTEMSVLELKQQEIIAEDKKMRDLLKVALKLSRLSASNILILGESGTGKGLLAKFIHKNGRRCNKPLIQINCAALPEHLLEAELFGYEKGAYTGARERGKTGLIELAQDGTLFLDEIGDMPLFLQAKLLKYLDDNEVLRIGGLKPTKINCTVIAATNQDLKALVAQRRFREDFYYRLNTFRLHLPPLRDRPDDIPGLVRHFLNRSNKNFEMNKQVRASGLSALTAYSFPGNVRELKNIIKNAVVMSDASVIDPFINDELGRIGRVPVGVAADSNTALPSLNETLEGVEKDILAAAYQSCRTTRQIAKRLGLSQPTVVRRLKKYGISVKNES